MIAETSIYLPTYTKRRDIFYTNLDKIFKLDLRILIISSKRQDYKS